MKRICMLLMLQALSFALFAQKGTPPHLKDKLEYKGYIVRLIPADFGTYGYIISKGQTVFLHQSRNPFTSVLRGLEKKEDVYKIAKWQIDNQKRINKSERPASHFASNGTLETSQGFSKRLPLTLANELQIAINTPRKPR